ncbi:hypothetical protein ILYODFUR_035175 [Ilyodon furcidens]|uniref:Uncharacterized protein n=1 Tax=Ilyodon furcidens TaxID=33524 RepID=A0ABV0U236_9TELE
MSCYYPWYTYETSSFIVSYLLPSGLPSVKLLPTSQGSLPCVSPCCYMVLLMGLCLPVILFVDSPWPLLFCSRKKSLLLTVTQSFRAFFSRTSSGFSHISSSGEDSDEALRPSVGAAELYEDFRLSSRSGGSLAGAKAVGVAVYP